MSNTTINTGSYEHHGEVFKPSLPVSQALKYVNELHHGYHAFACEDGFVFKSEEIWPEFCFGPERDGDRVEETFEVFPIIDGMVSLKHLRQHMGY